MPFVATDRVGVDLSRCVVQQQKAAELMELIKLDRLFNPNIFNWKLKLIVGLHHFVACKILGNALARVEDWQERDRILEQMKLKTLWESNCSQGGEIITQPAKTIELTKELEYTQKTLEPLSQKLEEVRLQAKLAAEARIKQWQLQWQSQFPAFRSLPVDYPAKVVNKAVQIQQPKRSITVVDEIDVQAGDRWFLEPHLIYCGDTSNYGFINSLPSNIDLAIATPSPNWDHDYLIDAARVVAVLRSEGYVHELCRHHQMSFKFELLISDIYVGIFSRQSIPRPQRPIEIEGLEGIVSYLVNLYTDRDSSVILPFLGAGEVLIACERLGRVCFAGDENPRLVSRAIARWQNLTGKQAYKLFYRS